MKGIKATALLVLCLALVIALAWPATAGEQRSALLRQYWGTITSIKIDRCGKRPGLCEGTMILAQHAGGEVGLAIRPGTWIKRGERLVLLVQAIESAAGRDKQATEIKATTPP